MYWKTLKIVTVVALLASPAALAAQNGTADLDGTTNMRDAASQILLAEHSHGSRGDVRGDRNRRFDGPPNRHFRPYGPPRFRGHPPRRFRGHPPRRFRGHPPRRFRGRPIRRLFRHWRRHY